MDRFLVTLNVNDDDHNHTKDLFLSLEKMCTKQFWAQMKFAAAFHNFI